MPHGGALLVHRTPERRWYPDAWDLPGGHVEPGEVPRLASERELPEELGIVATVIGAPFAHVQGRAFQMDVWLVVTCTGEPINMDVDEHDALARLTAQEVGCWRLVNPQLTPLDRHGQGWKSLRAGLDAPDGWPLYLGKYEALARNGLDGS